MCSTDKALLKDKRRGLEKEVELAKELRQGLEHPNIIKYCWHSESMRPLADNKYFALFQYVE